MGNEVVIMESNIIDLDINKVSPNLEQPRKTFDEEHLRILSDSILEYGVFQPILVKKIVDGTYQIISGECRWRASKMAGKDTIPVIIKDYEDVVSDEIALIENIQRRDLNPVDEALSFKTYLDKYNVSQKELADKVGKSRAYISTSIRLLDLGNRAVDSLVDGKLSVGQAKLLLTVSDINEVNLLCDRIEKENLNVRQLEKIIKEKQLKKTMQCNNVNSENNKIINTNLIDITGKQHIISKLQSDGLCVSLKGDKSRGILSVSYFSEVELDNVLLLLGGSTNG